MVEPKGTMIDREGEVLFRNAPAFVDSQRFDEMDDEEYRFTVVGE